MKAERKILVTEKLSESAIKNIGGNRWMKRKGKALLVLFVLCLLWAFMTAAILKDSLLNSFVIVAPLLLAFIGWAWKYSKEGTKFWNEVKDKPEPVDLG